MTYKKFKKINIILTVILGMIFGISISLKYIMLPIVAFIVFSLINLYLRKRVVEIISDERDFKIAGESASLSLKIFSIIGVIIALVLYYLDNNAEYKLISLTLSFSVCILMLLYSFIFKIKINKNN
ncbi:hypothetical protein SDC9_07954 [bioreactor metagenome]|uniref:DUF2178 domain-containing protein n=1 Tax=bioreactor metagenome TaxID=1076179 RepID=A0A644T656_9ZZZZ|nr:DUF2178 domain-containing protein [Candidatus Elulimicrobiales bacterium]